MPFAGAMLCPRSNREKSVSTLILGQRFSCRSIPQTIQRYCGLQTRIVHLMNLRTSVHTTAATRLRLSDVTVVRSSRTSAGMDAVTNAAVSEMMKDSSTTATLSVEARVRMSEGWTLAMEVGPDCTHASKNGTIRSVVSESMPAHFSARSRCESIIHFQIVHVPQVVLCSDEDAPAIERHGYVRSA